MKRTILILAALLVMTVGAAADDHVAPSFPPAEFDYFEAHAYHESTGGRSVINSGIDLGCLGGRMPFFGKESGIVGKIQGCVGFERAEGIYSTAVAACYRAACFRVERLGGDADPATGLALDWEYTPGQKLFGIQPVITLGLSWHDQFVTSDSARCLDDVLGQNARILVANGETAGELISDCQQPGLLSDRLAFHLGIGGRI